MDREVCGRTPVEVNNSVQCRLRDFWPSPNSDIAASVTSVFLYPCDALPRRIIIIWRHRSCLVICIAQTES